LRGRCPAGQRRVNICELISISHRRKRFVLRFGKPHFVGIVGAEFLIAAIGEHEQEGEG